VYSGGTFTILDAPGAIETLVISINNSGQVTGRYSDYGPDGPSTHGFMYGNGKFTILDVPGALGTTATSINANGQVAGSYLDSLPLREHGFVYSGGTFTIFDAPDTASTLSVTSINDSGQVAGYYWDKGPGTRIHGFVYGNDTFTILDAPGAYTTTATSINASGQVTGYYQSVDDFSHGFVYSNGVFSSLKVQSFDTVPASINANGQVTGYYVTQYVLRGASYTSAFVYNNGVFTTLDVPGAEKRVQATSINSSGQVTGFYTLSRQYGFIATPVCATPTVTVHTVTTAPRGGFRITGSITHEGAPLCALVLANGQSMFTCGDPLPKGDFDLTVPVDDQGQITLFGFSSGLAPFQQTLGPGALPASVNATGNATRCATPKVTYTTAAAHQGQLRITGSITYEDAPLCALVLANGQSMFTCGDPLPKGDFDLTVPPDEQGKITLFGFAAGLLPFQQTFSPSSTPP
jgi:probable HAF family extracellular repeat protein